MLMIYSPPSAFKPSFCTGPDYADAWYLHNKLPHWRTPAKAGCRGIFSSASQPLQRCQAWPLCLMLFLYNAEPSKGQSSSSRHLLTETEYSEVDFSTWMRPQLTTVLLRWKGIIQLKLISTETRADTFRHLNNSIRHLQPEIEITFLLPCLLTWVLMTPLS